MTEHESHKRRRAFLGMYFKCCNVYRRIYLNKAGTAFAGNCPKCGARVTIEISPGGSSSKFWVAE